MLTHFHLFSFVLLILSALVERFSVFQIRIFCMHTTYIRWFKPLSGIGCFWSHNLGLSSYSVCLDSVMLLYVDVIVVLAYQMYVCFLVIVLSTPELFFYIPVTSFLFPPTIFVWAIVMYIIGPAGFFCVTVMTVWASVMCVPSPALFAWLLYCTVCLCWLRLYLSVLFNVSFYFCCIYLFSFNVWFCF